MVQHEGVVRRASHNTPVWDLFGTLDWDRVLHGDEAKSWIKRFLELGLSVLKEI